MTKSKMTEQNFVQIHVSCFSPIKFVLISELSELFSMWSRNLSSFPVNSANSVNSRFHRRNNLEIISWTLFIYTFWFQKHVSIQSESISLIFNDFVSVSPCVYKFCNFHIFTQFSFLFRFQMLRILFLSSACPSCAWR